MAARILVVDHEKAFRDIVSSMLTSAGYRCQQVSSGVEALRILESNGTFELLLYDLTMSDVNGIELLKRSEKKYPDMTVLVVAPIHEIPAALTAVRDGADDYLLKPFTREQLLSTVHRTLENHRLELENPEVLKDARTERWCKAMANLDDITMEAYGVTLALKDTETEGHSKRVTAFTIAIAKAMGLPREQILIIARGAFLHDIGKIAIPGAILRKPGSLTPDEITTMKEHCYKGYQIIRKIPFLTEACEIVYSHQEHYDGTGYPRGLRGKEIPLGARLVAVANTLDAITCDRPYRPAQTVQAARAEIEKWSGRQFDPNVVKVFLEMPEKIWIDLRKDIDAQA